MIEKIPVLIAARNEEQYIGQTLASLDRNSVEPFVVVNDSHDATAQIAEDAHAHVYDISEPGKIHAIQYGLRKLGKNALGPLLYLDADTSPIYPRHWAQSMIRGLGKAGVGGGLFLASDGSNGERLFMSTLRVANLLEKRIRGHVAIGGMNMITHLSADTLDATLALDNIWLDEDTIRSNAAKGNKPKKLILRPTAAVRTSSRYLASPIEQLRMGRKNARRAAMLNRLSRTVAGVSLPKE